MSQRVPSAVIRPTTLVRTELAPTSLDPTIELAAESGRISDSSTHPPRTVRVEVTDFVEETSVAARSDLVRPSAILRTKLVPTETQEASKSISGTATWLAWTEEAIISLVIQPSRQLGTAPLVATESLVTNTLTASGTGTASSVIVPTTIVPNQIRPSELDPTLVLLETQVNAVSDENTATSGAEASVGNPTIIEPSIVQESTKLPPTQRPVTARLPASSTPRPSDVEPTDSVELSDASQSGGFTVSGKPTGSRRLSRTPTIAPSLVLLSNNIRASASHKATDSRMWFTREPNGKGYSAGFAIGVTFAVVIVVIALFVVVFVALKNRVKRAEVDAVAPEVDGGGQTDPLDPADVLAAQDDDLSEVSEVQ